MASQNYRDLIVWQRSMDLVERVYRLSSKFPREEMYGITSQMRRSAVSIPSNIAEGQGRGNGADFIRLLRIAHGSLRELETQLMIAHRLGYLPQDDVAGALELAALVGKMLNGLMKSNE